MNAHLERGEVSERVLELLDDLVKELDPARTLQRVELEIGRDGLVWDVWLHQKLRTRRSSQQV